MESIRKPFQGIFNIVRFNWHFYAMSGVFLALLYFGSFYLPVIFQPYIFILIVFIVLTTSTSLLVSYYVYDFSDLYKLNWISKSKENLKIVNINAGFDETSFILRNKFRNSKLIVLDFYQPEIHTEVSIKRAQKAYPEYPGTLKISTSKIDLKSNSADKIFLIFAAHEIRDDEERSLFFTELNRILKPKGEIYLTEHLRDFQNFLAYSIGFFHFLPNRIWRKTFDESNLIVKKRLHKTLFVTNFILCKNGNTP